MRKVYIETLGCMKNQYDSEVAAKRLERRGYTITKEPEEADILMVNTCGFIEDAKVESIDAIFDMTLLKKQDLEHKKIAVTGCLSKRYGDELAREIPEVDVFIGVDEYDDIATIFDRLYEKETGDLSASENESHASSRLFLKENQGGPLPREERRLLDGTFSAPLKIAEGCNNACAYCIIPKIRGRYRSKKIEDIVFEAQELSKDGCKELVLIAQDLTYYGLDIYKEASLPRLLRELVKVEGIEWIRLMYCYEERITDELIEVIKTEPKICKYIDIPMQHGSNRILKAMRRHTTRESMENTVAKLRAEIPEIVIRTTFIVGFPGENDEDFKNLKDFICKNRFDRLGVFIFSREEGTEAFDMEDQVESEVMEARRDEIMELQRAISYENNQKYVGKTLRVLVDQIDTDPYTKERAYFGRTQGDAYEIDNLVEIECEKEHQLGDFVDVKILSAEEYDLYGIEVFEV